MTIFPILIDARPAYLPGSGPCSSLLKLPLAADSLLGHLYARVADLTTGKLVILNTFDERPGGYPTPDHPAVAARGGMSVVSSFHDVLELCEPSDWLLMVDVANFPVRGYPADELLEATGEARRVTHLVVVDQGPEHAQERVLLNSRGSVRRIQRYYSGVTLVGPHAVACSLVSGAAARGVADERFESLTRYRQMLAEHSVPCRDAFLDHSTVDLSDEAGLLDLSEWAVRDALDARRAGNGHGPAATGRFEDVCVGSGCRVDGTARIFGPAVLHEDVVIEAGATIIGPTLLARGTHVGRDAIVAQCMATPGARVAAGAAEHRRLLSPGTEEPEATVGRVAAAAPPTRFAPRASCIADGELTSSNSTAEDRGAYPLIKAIIDSAIALVALLILSPLLAIVAVLIRLESRGPVLFADPREGQGGRVFRCWKFRTMYEGAHEQQRALYAKSQVDGPQFKMRADPRITRIGRFLRETNIDELPQLINVFFGQMSLIGPRPSPFRENQICVAWRRARLSVRPGITGLWQVCRHERSVGDFHQWIHFDILYVRHLTFLLDVRILLATLATFGGRWSVPASWMVPTHQMYDDAEFSLVPRRAPILDVAPMAATSMGGA